jgi:uncharacterized membrane-anchored protein YhcB (DUF1043 family)
MPEEKKSYTWIIYVAGAIAVVIIGYAVYQLIAGNNPGNQGLTSCQQGASTALSDYQSQYDAYQKQNGNQPLSQQQLSVLNDLFNNYQAAEQQCISLAASLNLANDITSPWLVVAAAIGIPVGLVAAYRLARVGSTGKVKVAPANDAQAMRDATTAKKVQSGEMSADDGAANAAQSRSIATDESASDVEVFSEQISELEAEYAVEQAALEDVLSEVLAEDSIASAIDETTLRLIGG